MYYIIIYIIIIIVYNSLVIHFGLRNGICWLKILRKKLTTTAESGKTLSRMQNSSK